MAKLLDPVDRLVEAMYSVLVMLTFTLAYRVAETGTAVGRQTAATEESHLLAAALGCAVAWGIIDGVMYVATAMFERGQQHRLIMTIRSAASEQAADALIADQLDDQLAPVANDSERAALYGALYQRLKGADPQTVGFRRQDFAGGLGTAIVAVAGSLPVLIPLLLSNFDPVLAIRLSNLVAFVMLFGLGYRWGHYVGAKPWKTGLALLLVGCVMVTIALALGG
jgi:hypothetical protein